MELKIGAHTDSTERIIFEHPHMIQIEQPLSGAKELDLLDFLLDSTHADIQRHTDRSRHRGNCGDAELSGGFEGASRRPKRHATLHT